MQRFRLVSWPLAVLILANLAMAQAAPSSPPPPAPQKPQGTLVDREEEAEARAAAAPRISNLPPTTPVITIQGVCEGPKAGAAAPKSGCTTVITRAEFEKLADTLQPNMPPQVRRQLASQYPQILYMSQEARKRGLEQNAHYLQMLKFTKMELLKLELERSFQQEADKVSETEVSAFYEKNSNNFEQTSFLRIFVPKTRQTDAPKEGATAAETDAARKDSEAVMAKVADDLHTRAAAGEDFDKLEKEAYEAAGVKAAAPPTSNPKVRRGNLPAAQSSVFELKAGELSPVINDPSGYYFYKIVSKTTPPLAETKDEIRTNLRTQRLQAMRQRIQSSVSADLNKDYFGGDNSAALPGMKGGPRSMPMNRAHPAPAPPPTQPKE